MESKFSIIFVLFSLLTLASAEKDVQDLIEDLKTSRLEAEKNLTPEQLDDVERIRSRVEALEHEVSTYNINEPLFSISETYFHKSISELIESKGTLCHKDEELESEQGIELYSKEFDRYVLEPCKIIDEAFKLSLDQFYQQAQETPDLGDGIRASDFDQYDWLLNAAVCRSILDDVDMMRHMSFGHVLCSRIVGY